MASNDYPAFAVSFRTKYHIQKAVSSLFVFATASVDSSRLRSNSVPNNSNSLSSPVATTVGTDDPFVLPTVGTDALFSEDNSDLFALLDRPPGSTSILSTSSRL
eukprot:CAMPEP_0197268110 /NCGR_PEP_ID=MMETSP1432-20130617/3979_1 /TAXON_ID=44447 /ORGANISM="Pseudo-nitzschia delicatissima, Strain UNC1205" /LENGTH=103 /DNA_ID=CAMNT_0042733129 /DNA_START=539 /DNA_END=850 /DNA_ORIENTATION=-